jgi:C-methyltransferase
MPPTAPSPTPILNLLQGFQASGILNAAIQLGAFRPLAGGPRPASRVARAIRCPERTTSILLDALCALGLMRKHERRYRLHPDAAKFLVPGRQDYIGDTARIMCDDVIWGAMNRFAHAVRNGGTVLSQHAESPNQKFWETFAENSDAFAAPAAEYAAGLLARFLEERAPSRVLDVACGGGLYGLTIAARCPGARAVLLDRAPVLASARKRARRMRVGRRAAFLPGDVFAARLGGPYHAIVASQIFHHFSLAACERLARRLGDALVPGGRILIHEFVADEDRTSNVHAALFAALMLAWTREGSTYTFSEYSRLLQKAGFTAPVLHAPPHLTSQFLVAERRGPRHARRR